MGGVLSSREQKEEKSGYFSLAFSHFLSSLRPSSSLWLWLVCLMTETLIGAAWVAWAASSSHLSTAGLGGGETGDEL